MYRDKSRLGLGTRICHDIKSLNGNQNASLSPPCDARHCGGKVGITEYHGGVFPSELQGDFLHRGGGQLGDPLTNQGGPSERDHPDLERVISVLGSIGASTSINHLGVCHNALPHGPPKPEDHVDHPGGKPRLPHEPAQHPGGDTGHLAGLAHHGVAGHDGGGDLKGEQVQREVPGGDEAGHAHRVSAGDVHHARPAHSLGGVHQTLPRMRKLNTMT